MDKKLFYTLDYDESIPTAVSNGVDEHVHGINEYWHPVGRWHCGCGRIEAGHEFDVRICVDCEFYDNPSMCHGRRREFGLNMVTVKHGDYHE